MKSGSRTVWSLDGGETYEPIEESFAKIEKGGLEGETVVIYVGERRELTHDDFFDMHQVFDDARRNSREEYDLKEYLNDLKSSKIDELQGVVGEWLDENVSFPNMFVVENIKMMEFVVPQYLTRIEIESLGHRYLGEEKKHEK